MLYLATAIPLIEPVEQGEIVEFIEEVCGIYFRSVVLRKGVRIPQHVHSEAHPTLVGSGSARLFVDGVYTRDVLAGHAVEIKVGQIHTFEALEDNTRLTCIWPVEVAQRMKETVWPG